MTKNSSKHTVTICAGITSASHYSCKPLLGDDDSFKDMDDSHYRSFNDIITKPKKAHEGITLNGQDSYHIDGSLSETIHRWNASIEEWMADNADTENESIRQRIRQFRKDRSILILVTHDDMKTHVITLENGHAYLHDDDNNDEFADMLKSWGLPDDKRKFPPSIQMAWASWHGLESIGGFVHDDCEHYRQTKPDRQEWVRFENLLSLGQLNESDMVITANIGALLSPELHNRIDEALSFHRLMESGLNAEEALDLTDFMVSLITHLDDPNRMRKVIPWILDTRVSAWRAITNIWYLWHAVTGTAETYNFVPVDQRAFDYGGDGHSYYYHEANALMSALETGDWSKVLDAGVSFVRKVRGDGSIDDNGHEIPGNDEYEKFHHKRPEGE